MIGKVCIYGTPEYFIITLNRGGRERKHCLDKKNLNETYQQFYIYFLG